MAQGSWFNYDGLMIQYGTQKVIPELGGDYLLYGENREIETYICLGTTSFGNGVVTVPGLPTTFSGTGAPIAAGIQSMTTLVPLQITTPVTVAGSNGVLTLLSPQVFWDSIDVECLVSANAGTGGATGITVGLVTTTPGVTTNSSFVQVTPNPGTQLIKSLLNAQMVAGKRYTFYPDGTVLGPTIGSSVAGDWMGTTTEGLQIPLVTNTITPLPNNAWISTLATGGTYTGASGGGLLKLRLKYGLYGVINQ